MEKEKLNLLEKLSNIQNELKAPKGQRNTFGNYNYRSCEDILEAIKPICKKHKTTLILSDELIVLGDNAPTNYSTREYSKEEKEFVDKENITGLQRYYIKATATLYDLESDKTISNTAYAREEEDKKGMDGSQITGTASSYARKYALNGLFNIDDTKDADTDEHHNQTTVTKKTAKISPATSKQIEIITKMAGASLPKILEVEKTTLENMTVKKANEIIQKINATVEKNQKEKEG